MPITVPATANALNAFMKAVTRGNILATSKLITVSGIDNVVKATAKYAILVPNGISTKLIVSNTATILKKEAITVLKFLKLSLVSNDIASAITLNEIATTSILLDSENNVATIDATAINMPMAPSPVAATALSEASTPVSMTITIDIAPAAASMCCQS